MRLFYPMAPLTLTPPENAEDCVWAEKTPDGLHALVRQDGRSAERHAPLPAPVEQGGETPEFSLASLTYDLLRDWTGIRPPWGKMTGVRPVRLIHDKRAAGWTEAEIDHFFLDRFDCSQQKYQMAKAIADLQEPILKVGNEPGPTACTSASRSARPGAATAALSAAIWTATARWCSLMWTVCAERWKRSAFRPTRRA